VERRWEQDEHTPQLEGKPGPILKKAARAARILNEAICSLSQNERLRVDTVVARHPWLSREERLRGSAKLFEIDELKQTVCLLDQMLSIAVGKSPPIGAGEARLSKRRGTKKGDVKNPAFHLFVYSLLREVEEFAGTLELEKNRNFHESGGALAGALTSLRPYLPEHVFPDGKLDLSTLQRIKTEHNRRQAQAALFEQHPELERDHVRRFFLSRQVEAHRDTKVDDSARRTATRSSDQN
jgi:hypothetical protein